MKIWTAGKKRMPHIQTRLFDKAPAGVSCLQKLCRPVSEVLRGEEKAIDREVPKLDYPVLSDDSSWEAESDSDASDF